MAEKRNRPSVKRPGTAEAEALDTLNARARRKRDVPRLMEATIEEKAKKRRESEVPASSKWKPGA